MNNVVREEVVEWISKLENEELLEALKLIKDSSGSKPAKNSGMNI